MKQKPKLSLISIATAALLVATLHSRAQQIYSEDFETDHSLDNTWTTNATGTSPADIYFDYSTIGIPLSPHSTGISTRGVKLNANLGGTSPTAGVSVSPTFSLPLSGNFEIHCDWWANFNGPAPAGGSGSTQVGGIGCGSSGTVANYVGAGDALFCVATPEGGSGADYRVYTPAFLISHQDPSGTYFAGGRNNTLTYHASNFPGQTAPAAQVLLYPQQTGTTAAGAQGWKWRNLLISKIGPFVTWSIDNIPIALFDITTNGTFGGDKIVLVHSDINATASTDPNAAALAFGLFDNLRVTNIVANIVSATASSPTGSEAGPAGATITLTRTITGSPLTVNYTATGTASNGTDYTNALGGALSGSITFAAGDSSTNIDIVPIDDGISEAVETAVITVANGVGYVAAGNATAAITDNDTPLLIASADASSMFERHANDYASVLITRWGDTNGTVTLTAANFSYAGSAVLSTDYIVNTGLFPFNLDPGVGAASINLVSPLDNSAYTGNKSVVVGLVAGGGFGVTASNANLTIIDDENPAATVLYTNSLTSAADAVNWNLTYAHGDLVNLPGNDYEASFGYDLTANASGGGVVLPPPGGANNALRVTVNKNLANNAGVDLYPTNVSFSGDFAVRFNMNIIIDTAGGTTQGPLFGINHNGFQTNWWAGSGVTTGGPWAADGIWLWASADGGAGAGDYILRTGLGGALPNTGFTQIAVVNNDSTVNGVSIPQVFKGPPAPYSGYAGPGLVGNDPNPADNSNWTDVQIKQFRNVVSLYINKIRLFNYTNTTAFTNGTVMLGYADPFNSVGAAAGAVYYANLSVVRITAPVITSITRSGSIVTILFSSTDGTDTPASYKLQGASVVTGPYADVGSSTITQLANGTFEVTTTSVAGIQFYRIRKL